MEEKTVYRAKNYKVKRNDDLPMPVYKVYDNDGIVVKTAKSQVEATMWVSRQRGKKL